LSRQKDGSMKEEIIKAKFEEIKKYIGETDAESRAKIDEFHRWLNENDSPEMQEYLSAFMEEGLSRLEEEVADLRKQIGTEYDLLPLSYPCIKIKAMEKIKVNIAWCDKNFGASIDDNKVPGSVVATDKTLDGVKSAIADALRFHVEGMLADGDAVPGWLIDGGYELDFYLEISALLRKCERYTSLAAIARASGINQQLLNHYASGLKIPRPSQRKRIVDGIHKIGEEFISVV